MDRNTLLAIILCFGIFLGWQKLYIEPQTQLARTQQVQQQTAQPPAAGVGDQGLSAPSAAAQPRVPSQPVKSLPLEVATGVARVGNGNRVFTGWDLKQYKTDLSKEAAAIDLEDVTLQASSLDLAFDRPEYAYLSNVRGDLVKTGYGALWTYEDENVKLAREIRAAGDRASVDVTFKADFKKAPPQFAYVTLGAQGKEDDPEERDRQLVYWTEEDIEREPVNDLGALRQISSPVKWIGATSRYFVMAAVSEGTNAPAGLIQPVGPLSGRISMVYPVQGSSFSVPVKAFFGPKELGLLRSVEPTLDHTVDFGIFTVFAYPLLKIMKGFYDLFHNYGISIILLTLLVKIATYPLTYKSMKSMKEMQKIQPQIQRVREKYKDDREALNREMLTLMRGHGYNPMAGCLPILIQMPIFFALYQVLYSSVELYQAPFYLWIQDLSAKDPYYVTPVLLGLAMYLQQKLTPTTITDPAQAKMMQLMPLIFVVFMLTLPAGLTLYMLINALASIVQQLILNKKLNVGNATPAAARAR